MVHPLLVKKAAEVATATRKRRIAVGVLGFLGTVGPIAVPLIIIVIVAMLVTMMMSVVVGGADKKNADSGSTQCTDTSISSLAYDKTSVESLDATQVKNAQTIVGTAKQLGYNKKAAEIALVTSLRESLLYNLQNKKYPESGKNKYDKVPSNYTWLEAGDHDSSGLFAQRQSLYKDWKGIQDPQTSAKWFFKGGPPGIVNYLDAVKGWESMDPAVAAQEVQNSAVPDGYISEKPLAKKLVDKLWGTVRDSGDGASSSEGGANAQNVSDAGGCGDVQVSGSMADLLKSWTWNDKPPNFNKTDQKPGYAQVIKQIQQEGGYTGSPTRRPLGDDCGVFVTAIITRSGHDKTYNYGGKVAKGAGRTSVQKQWMEKNWKKLGPGSKLQVNQLKPGDVGINSHHVWVYIGNVEGLNGNWAEASERFSGSNGFAPMNRYQNSVLYANEADTTYYRKK